MIYKIKKFFGRVGCFFGHHKWVTLKQRKCSMTFQSILFRYTSKTDGMAFVKQCPKCGLYWGYVTDGIDKETVDVDYLLSQMN